MTFAKTIAAAAVLAFTVGAYAQTAPVPAAAPVVEKRICRSSLETGSLVKKHKVCLTAAQWRYVTDKSSEDARRVVDDSAGRPACTSAATC